MGLGKTVMTIALVLSNPRGETSEIYDSDSEISGTYIKGGTLIVCPMALLGQWKVNCCNYF
jgi:DNA repair protein RAD5